MNVIEKIGETIKAAGIEEENQPEVTKDILRAICFRAIEILPPEEKERLEAKLQSLPVTEFYRQLNASQSYTEALGRATSEVLTDWLAEVLPASPEGVQRDVLSRLETM